MSDWTHRFPLFPHFAGTCIAFATHRGKPAYTGRHKDEASPFTQQFVECLSSDEAIGEPHMVLFSRVRTRVHHEAAQRGIEQWGECHDDILGAPFYFRPYDSPDQVPVV